jgi:hypothetical protein
MIRYHVNKDKGIVIAYFYDADTKMSGLELLRNDLSHYGFSRTICRPRSRYFYIDTIDSMNLCVDKFLKGYHEASIYGKAKLNPEDQWDEEVGKRIAKERLLIKERRIFRQFGKFIMHDLKILLKSVRSNLI